MFKTLSKFFLVVILVTLSGCSLYSQQQSSVKNTRNFHTQYLPVKQGRLEYVRFGSGSPIVFISGYTADIATWDERMLVELARQHEIILFNNRNVGCSCIHSNDYCSSTLAEDTDQLIRGLRLKKPAILGYSMGGVIAQQLAVSHPDEVGQLILMSTFIAGHQAIPPTRELREKLFPLPRNPLKRFVLSLQLFFPESWRLRVVFELIFHRFIPPGYPYDEFPSDHTLNQQEKLIRDWYANDAMTEKIAHLSKPTLVLSGDADIIVVPENSERLFSNIPHAQWVRWKEGGHAMEFQFPVEIAKTINHFLAQYS